jgi:ribosomal 30S subunit maturation factor RimM
VIQWRQHNNDAVFALKQRNTLNCEDALDGGNLFIEDEIS